MRSVFFLIGNLNLCIHSNVGILILLRQKFSWGNKFTNFIKTIAPQTEIFQVKFDNISNFTVSFTQNCDHLSYAHLTIIVRLSGKRVDSLRVDNLLPFLIQSGLG